MTAPFTADRVARRRRAALLGLGLVAWWALLVFTFAGWWTGH